MSDLVESVEGIVIKALAEQSQFASWTWGTPQPTYPDSRVVTRDIINAFADALGRKKKLCIECGQPNRLIRDLRSQATPDSESRE